MTGVGKSTIGIQAAERLGYRYFDLDAVIEERENEKIPLIFSKYGEEGFREIEHKYLVEIIESNNDGVILSCGGGIVCLKKNVKLLVNNSYVVWIKRDICDIINDKGVLERPPHNGSPDIYMANYAKRENLYKETADCVIENKFMQQSVSDLVKKLEVRSKNMKEDNIDFTRFDQQRYKHLIDFSDLSENEWNDIFTLAEQISKDPGAYSDYCKGKILATLFYEPSTRTVFSFQSAMMRLGGNYISFTGTENSSVSKGENLRDTIKIVNNYADIIALRHPLEGAAYAASLYSNAPVINAGDGGHLHPTQTMLDIFTIQKLKNSCENLSVGICGDLKYGRTVHSLLKAFEPYKNNKFYLISVPELALPEQFMTKLKENNEFVFCDTIEECIENLDVIYMTRIQKERLSAGEDYKSIKNKYILDQNKLASAKNDLIILHPLPKVDEISYEVDDDPRAKYFLQAEFGLYVRMALILTLTGNKNVPPKIDYTEKSRCPNKKCVTNTETYLPRREKIIGNKTICTYCEHYID